MATRRAWAIGVAAVAGLVAAGMAARAGSPPWKSIGWAVVLTYVVLLTLAKLTRDAPTVTTWDGHVRYVLMATGLMILGFTEAATAAGDASINRLEGALVFLAGLVMFVAERRDLLLWSAEREREREEAARQAKARAEEPRDRAW